VCDGKKIIYGSEIEKLVEEKCLKLSRKEIFPVEFLWRH
jgi:hypothetical protein